MKNQLCFPTGVMHYGASFMRALVGIAVFAMLASCATTGPGVKHFKSRKGHFEFSYPRHWTTGIPRRPETRAIVYSPINRTNCRVNVRKLSPRLSSQGKELLKKLTPAEFARIFAKRLPHARILDSRRTTLGGQEAIFFLLDLRPGFADIRIRMSVLTTYYDDKFYYVGCGTKKYLYQQELPNFNLLYKSFRFLDR